MGALDEYIDNLMSSAADFELEEIESTALSIRLNGSRNLLNFKGALLRRVFSNEEEKVGIIGSRTRIGQAVQGAATIAIPGDTSQIRSPVRSTVYSAITPGGGGGGGRRLLGLARRAGPKQGPLRCPVGYEFGGRFASKNLANCGRQLFDLPGGLGIGIGAGRGIGLLGLLKREGQLVNFNEIDTPTVQIQRAAQIARVGSAKDGDRIKAVDVGIAALSDPTVKGGLLVRKDATTLRTKVTNDVLGTIRENPDMEDASLISAAKSPAQIGDNGVASIWIGNVKSMSYALPGGGSITVERKDKLSNGQKRVLTKAWTANATTDFGKNNYGARLRDIVEKSNGTLTYTEKFPNIDNPNDLVTVGEVGNPKNRMSVQRWVHETFMADNAPGRGENKPYKEVGKAGAAKTPVASADISKLNDAIKHLEENGDPEEIPASILGQALSKSKAFNSSQIRPGVTMLERPDGKSWYRTESSGDYAHLAERVSADIHSALGLDSPPVTFIGEGSRRDYLVASPQNEAEGTVFNVPISKIDSDDLLRMSVSDYLLDQRDRNPSNMRATKRNENNRLALGGNDMSALAGLSPEELKSRRAMVLEDYLKENRIGQVAEKFNALSTAQRKAMLDVYEDLVKRATEFNWTDYSTRLGIDGNLSAAEKAHLDLIKVIYTQRVETLRSAKKRYLQAIGVQ
jgi:hypothetical protein